MTPVIESMADAVCRVYPEIRYVPASLITRVLFFIGYHSPDFLVDFSIQNIPALKAHT